MSSEDEIRRLRGEVERHQSITEMIAGVTHDLATPLGITQPQRVYEGSLGSDPLRGRTSIGDRRARCE